MNASGIAAQLRAWAERVGALEDDALMLFVADIAKVRGALDALWVTAAGVVDDRGCARRMGFRRTEDWLAVVAGERPGAMHRDVELAAALAEAPAVDDAMRDGLSKAKAAELVYAATLPVDVQKDLITQAGHLPVNQVASAVRKARLDHGQPER